VDDHALTARVRQFEAQLLPHLPDLYRAARRLVPTGPDAEDLVQETCLRAFRSLDQLRDPGAARAWLFAVLRSVFLRSATRRAATIPERRVDLEASASLDGSRTGGSLAEVSLEEIREAVLRLPLPYRDALVLAHIGGFSYREMARILEVPVGPVMSRLFRARRLVRAFLREASERPCPSEASP